MIIVEVLGRGGRVVERVRLAQLPATVGRGYACDVIVEDPYADAAHARLVEGENGAVVVEDLGSANGLFDGEFGARQASLVLRPGAAFRVGHTLLRVATSDTPVAPVLRDTGPGSRPRRALHSRLTALVLTLLVAPLFGLSFYLTSTEHPGRGGFVTGLLTGVAVVAAWAGAWALGTRVRSGRSRFAAHVSVAWLAFGAALLVAVAEAWFRFLTADARIADAAGVLAAAAIIILPVYGQLSIASRMRRGMRLLVGVGVTLGMLGLAALLEQAGFQENDQDITIAMPLKPLAPRWIPAETPASFLDRAAQLQDKVDKEAAAQAQR